MLDERQNPVLLPLNGRKDGTFGPMNDQPSTPDRRNAIIAVILIAVGAIFLIGEIFSFRIGDGFWPLFILVPGLALLYSAFAGSTANAGTAAGGAVLTTLGLIFFFQVGTGNWESWAYIWALLPLSAGVGQIAAGTRNDDEGLIATGRNTARIFGIVFLVGLAFFELIIFDRGGFGGYLLPVALIVIGGSMLWLRYRRTGSLPFGDMFSGAEGSGAPAPPSPGPGASAGMTAAKPPTTASPPPMPPEDGPSPAEHFPEDGLPEAPPPDDAPFPADEQSPQAPEPKPKPRRRATGSRARKPPAPPEGSQDNS
jgi:hypothetical protein